MKTMTLREIREAYNFQNLWILDSDVFLDWRLQIFEEDAFFEHLHLDDSFFYTDNGIKGALFLKNLTVQNELIQPEMDFGPVVMVCGDTTAKNIFLGGGEIAFGGRVKAAQTFVAGCYNHGWTGIFGDVEAEVIIMNDHAYECKGSVTGLWLPDEDEEFRADDVIKHKFFVLYEDNLLDYDKILQAARKGESILKQGKPLNKLEAAFERLIKSGGKKAVLSELALAEIPERLYEFNDLEALDISANAISALPEKILQFGRLKTLKLIGCDFEEFPVILSRLPALDALEMQSNLLQGLPRGEGEFPKEIGRAHV
jgi:hypothetical protein